VLAVTLSQIYEARRRIDGIARRTPLETSLWLSKIAGQDVCLKLEAWQRTGSFKIRGAYNAVAALDPDRRARGIVTASAGNHGQAVALAAREVGARATIFVPADAPDTKKRRIESFGAKLHAASANYDDAEVAARAFADQTGATFVHAFSDPDVVAGQGTIGLEILDDFSHVRNVIVPVGGGGLIGGIGCALKAASSSINVIGVQSTRTTAMYDAFKAGRPVPSPVVPTLADGLAGQIDERSYTLARTVVDAMHVVPEDSLPAAIRTLYQDGVVAEGAAAVAAAAIAEGVVRVDGPTVVVVSGSNIDAHRLAAILTSK
jgi:threonine dehydratase